MALRDCAYLERAFLPFLISNDPTQYEAIRHLPLTVLYSYLALKALTNKVQNETINSPMEDFERMGATPRT